MAEPRVAELRINEADRESIKNARDTCFDQSTALGYVARVACERLTDEADDGVRL
jgi:hypothetical protein